MIYGSISVQGAKCLLLCLMESQWGMFMQLFTLELNSLSGPCTDKPWIRCQEVSCASWWLNVDYVCTVNWYAHLRFVARPIALVFEGLTSWSQSICSPFSLTKMEMICLWDSLLEKAGAKAVGLVFAVFVLVYPCTVKFCFERSVLSSLNYSLYSVYINIICFALLCCAGS